MSDIFREVDEALSREKAAAFWKNYGPTLILAAVIMVLSTAITTGYRHWDSSQNQKQTAKLVSAAGDPDIVAAMEKTAADARDTHKAIALLAAAHKAAEDNDFAKAQTLYETVSNDGGAPDDLRDLSTILAVRTSMLQSGDTAPDYKAHIEKLSSVAKNNKSAFQAMAKVEAALLYGDGLKDYTSALDLLKGIDSKNASGSLSEKATALSHVYQYELSVKPSQE